jgi:hypothetical protein
VPVIIVMGFIFMVLTITKNYFVRYWFQPGFGGTIEEAFRAQSFTTFITGLRLMSIWLLAYYAYSIPNFHISVLVFFMFLLLLEEIKCSLTSKWTYA